MKLPRSVPASFVRFDFVGRGGWDGGSDYVAESPVDLMIWKVYYFHLRILMFISIPGIRPQGFPAESRRTIDKGHDLVVVTNNEDIAPV